MARGAVGTTTDAPLASIGILSALPYRYRREAIRDAARSKIQEMQTFTQ